MKKPIIGITPQYDYKNKFLRIHEDYMRAIKASGAIPYMLPLEIDEGDVGQLISLFDGFLFPGGPDINPFLFKEETIPEGGIVIPERDNFEKLVFDAAYNANKPMLGICRGIQAFNIFLGGGIYQDIKTQYHSNNIIGHYQKSPDKVKTHSVDIISGSLLDKILNKKKIKVNSFHHQALSKLAPSLDLSAISKDSLAEAVYDKSRRFLLGVQWHPEHLHSVDGDQFKIFEAFVRACVLTLP